MTFYAVKHGKNIGIFLNWVDCDDSVNGYTNALYKKCDTREEAYDFINSKADEDVRFEITPYNTSKKLTISEINTIDTFKSEKQRLLEQKKNVEKLLDNFKQDIIDNDCKMFEFCKQNNGHDMTYDTNSGIYEKSSLVCSICGFEN